MCPDRGAGNDPEAVGFALHHQGHYIHAYCMMHIVKLLQTLLIETKDYQRWSFSSRLDDQDYTVNTTGHIMVSVDGCLMRETGSFKGISVGFQWDVQRDDQ